VLGSSWHLSLISGHFDLNLSEVMVPFDAVFSGIEDLIDNHHRKKRLTSISSVMKKMMCLSNEIEPLFVAKMKWNLIIMLILYLVWSCFIDSPFRERELS
jgi:hypothetical protein